MAPEPSGRYLLARTRPFARDQPVRVILVWGFQMAVYLNSGWQFVATDPDPDRYAAWRKVEDDGA